MDEKTAYEIGIEGYVFLYPLVLMEITRRQMTNVENTTQRFGRGPMDTFAHIPAFPPADFKDVVRPNFDTLYSVAWLDVSSEPRLVTIPAAEDNYYLLPLYDMWGEVFACPGVRTTGSDALTVAVCPPDWPGELPAGVRAYVAPTPTVWIIGRTEASVATYDKVHEFQRGMTITPLSQYGGPPPAVMGHVDPSIDNETPPLRTVFDMDAAEFFALAAELLKQNKPHAQDYPVLDRLAQIGFVSGQSFDLAHADTNVRAGLGKAVSTAQEKITDFQTKVGTRQNGWLLNIDAMGNYGTWYLKRAMVELVGLGANLPEDAIYPLVYSDSDGQPLDGANRYVWHMSKDEIPPVNAFWSLTLYDAEGFQVANELDRFAIGDRNEIEYNSDGSLDILIQHTAPESGTSNWLPAPAGGFNLTARLYWPRPSVFDGTWVIAPIQKVE